jgi:hypothetical protein
MYYKSLIVVALCSIFVIAFAGVLGYVTSGIGSNASTTSTLPCTVGSGCQEISIYSASLNVVNYTDELGIVTYTNLVMSLAPNETAPMSSAIFFLNGSEVGSIRQTFTPGVHNLVNLTLPATAIVYPGKTYSVRVEGDLDPGPGTIWGTTEVIAT